MQVTTLSLYVRVVVTVDEPGHGRENPQALPAMAANSSLKKRRPGAKAVDMPYSNLFKKKRPKRPNDWSAEAL